MSISRFFLFFLLLTVDESFGLVPGELREIEIIEREPCDASVYLC